MNIISIENLTKSFNEKILFENISLGVEDSDRIGIVGINGTGKSTFLKLVYGSIEPDSGRIIKGKNVTVQFLSQDLEFDENMTVLEHIFNGENPAVKILKEYETTVSGLEKTPDDKDLQKKLMDLTIKMDGLDGWNLETRAKSILSKLGITETDRRIGELSGGLKKRAALAEALIQPADLLILDEPTNHIDLETIEWLEEYLGERKGALLLVTHDRYFLNRVVNRIIEIDRGKLYSYEGNFEYFIEKKMLREEAMSAMERKNKRLYARELDWIRHGAKARTTKQKARIQRFESLEKGSGNGETMAGISRMPGMVGGGINIDIPVAYTRLGKKVIEFENVSKSFGGQPVIKNFSLIVKPDDRIGIVGPNGTGKTILLNLIAGLDIPDKGRVDMGSTVKTAYYRQNNEDMDNSVRAIDYIKQTAEYVEASNGSTITASQMLERFLFDGSHQYSFIKNLSGGEKKRLYLAKILIEKPNVLLLDEPTNDLDIQTLEVLEEYIEYFQGAVLVVSHDRYFLDKVTDRIIFVRVDGKVEFHNNLDAYRRSAAAAADKQKVIQKYSSSVKRTKESQSYPRKETPELDKNRTVAPDRSYPEAGGKAKFTFAEKKEFSEIDSMIEKLERELVKIEEEISKSWADPARMRELAEQQKKIQAELAEKMERWVYLNEKAEKIKNQ